MDFTEHKLSSQTVYRGVLLDVVADQVRLPDGATAQREYIRHPGAVVMVPFLDPGTVILVRQYRYPLGRHFEEIPAGKAHPGEDRLATARRELREECGYEARDWRRLTTLHPCIGYSDESIDLFVARDLVRVGPPQLDEGEFLEVMPVPLAEALAWVRAGRITDTKTIIGLLWADKFKDG
ncbi:MAG TPA: NUDIX hydrolase [Burkholderiales bacterium]|nr:NUDIX hydrolase [Burkholderiales bacterium]